MAYPFVMPRIIEEVLSQLTLLAEAQPLAAQPLTLPTGYVLRLMHAQDATALAALYFAAYDDTIVPDLSAAQEEMQQTFADEYGELALTCSPVLVYDTTLVSAVMTVVQAPWPDTPTGPFIIEVFTHPAHRQRSLARAGLISAAQAALQQGWHTLALRVDAANTAALTLYSALGFRLWQPDPQ